MSRRLPDITDDEMRALMPHGAMAVRWRGDRGAEKITSEGIEQTNIPRDAFAHGRVYYDVSMRPEWLASGMMPAGVPGEGQPDRIRLVLFYRELGQHAYIRLAARRRLLALSEIKSAPRGTPPRKYRPTPPKLPRQYFTWDQLAPRTRAEHAARMRDAGLTYSEIGKRLGGVSMQRARQLVLKGQRQRRRPDEKMSIESLILPFTRREAPKLLATLKAMFADRPGERPGARVPLLRQLFPHFYDRKAA